MTELLANSPIGKTLDIVYLRDGETKNTKLTTISREELERLNTAFRNRPEGRGQFGYEDGDAERVAIPGTKMFGVRLGEVLPNRPADMAGVKSGDIVIEFDGVPIRTSDEFLSRVRRALPYSTINLVVMRGEERVEIPVKMGQAVKSDRVKVTGDKYAPDLACHSSLSLVTFHACALPFPAARLHVLLPTHRLQRSQTAHKDFRRSI